MIDFVNQNLRKLFSVFLLIIFLTSNVFAQEIDPDLSGASNLSNQNLSNSINMCPISVAFGLYSFNYEHLFDQTHGLIARFDYESISDSYSDNPIEVGGYGFILNYRYH